MVSAAAALPLFHLYGDPPDDQAFDFIHIETIASRSSIHDWTIRAHRHRNLFQILLIGGGGGEMTYEAAIVPFEAPCAMLVPSTTAHGFRFRPATDGWVITFTEDVAEALGDRRNEAMARMLEWGRMAADKSQSPFDRFAAAALIDLQKREFEKAEDKLKTVAESGKANFFWHFIRAATAAENLDFRAAERELSSALELEPANRRATQLLAELNR